MERERRRFCLSPLRGIELLLVDSESGKGCAVRKQIWFLGSYFPCFTDFKFLKNKRACPFNKGEQQTPLWGFSHTLWTLLICREGHGVLSMYVQSGLLPVLMCFISDFRTFHIWYSVFPGSLARCQDTCSIFLVLWDVAGTVSDFQSLPAYRAGEFALEAIVTFLIQVDSLKEMPIS